MKFFIDTADTAEIKELIKTGMVDGVTTNPSLIAKSGRDFKEVVAEICSLVDGPVSAEVTATDAGTMIDQGQTLAEIAKNVCIKVPLTVDGLIACRALRGHGSTVNVTLCFSPAQAILAAKAGASFISPFVGRLDDIAIDGMKLISDIVTIYRQYAEFQTEVLVASIRHPQHVVESSRLGADVATIPPKILRQMYEHPLTSSGLQAFLDDWGKTDQNI